jgi:hypothetical protein
LVAEQSKLRDVLGDDTAVDVMGNFSIESIGEERGWCEWMYAIWVGIVGGCSCI